MRGRGLVAAKALMASVSLVILGGILGVALDRHLMRGSMHSNSAELHEAALTSLQRRLDLDSIQRIAVDSILRKHHAVLRQTWASLHTRLGLTLDSVHRDIAAALTPEQQTEFRKWLEEMSRPDP